MIKKIASISTIFVLSLVNINSVDCFASDNIVIKSQCIPEQLAEYTEIEYVSDSEFIIVSDSKALPETETRCNPSYPKPEKGMKVKYASDGLIYKILNSDGTEPDYRMTENLNEQNLIEPFQLVYPDLLPKPFASWGTGNYLYKAGMGITGIGRATTFDDYYGQSDIINHKGSVATKLAYDNCKVNLPVKVTTLTSSGVQKTMYMTKTDAGGMPNAVLDIWKTGVEYWGYTWNSYFSMPYNVIYEHENK